MTETSKTAGRAGRPRKWKGAFAEWMISNKIHPEELADEVEVDLSTVFRWCRGEQFPSLPTAQSIAEFARRSGRTLTLDDLLAPRGHFIGRGKPYGVLSRPTAQTGNRRLATAQK
jgi:transcriptional regulator with XRE-family HTH domain